MNKEITEKEVTPHIKKILYLTFYYEPDLCAGSFRNTPLTKELARKIGNSGEVHVVTTFPNRYSSFKQEAAFFENHGNLFIYRIKIPSHNSGILDQIKSFTTYFRKAIKITKGQHFDLIIASSSRLFTAFLGKRISGFQKAPLYLDIRDIFVDTIAEVVKNKVFRITGLPFIKLIEYYTFFNANHINLISEGFKPYFEYYNKPQYSHFTNGIDPEFLVQNESGFLKWKKVKRIIYAGNIGSGQGLENVIPHLVKELHPGYHFTIIGDGGRKRQLVNALKQNGLSNEVSLLPPMNREDLIRMFKTADYFFLHLNNFSAFEKVLPSKIFDYGAFNVPIIAGVAGFARNFIQENLPNSIIFEPNNPDDLIFKLKEYKYHLFHRKKFINTFNRDFINAMMVESILGYVKL